MPDVVLFFFDSLEDEGIIPVSTFVYPDVVQNDYLEKANFFLDNMIQKLIVEDLPEPKAWIKDIDNMDFEEEDWHGYLYAELQDDAKISLPANAYHAAKIIATTLVESDTWGIFVAQDSKYTLSPTTLADLPEDEPVLPATPVDPRFEIGQILVNARGKRFKYMGVLWNPDNKRVTKRAQEDLWAPKLPTVLVGLNNTDYVTETQRDNWVADNTIEIYPLPLFAVNYLPKGSAWFTRVASSPKIEGYGKTEQEAKEDLAVKVLFFK